MLPIRYSGMCESAASRVLDVCFAMLSSRSLGECVPYRGPQRGSLKLLGATIRLRGPRN